MSFLTKGTLSLIFMQRWQRRNGILISISLIKYKKEGHLKLRLQSVPLKLYFLHGHLSACLVYSDSDNQIIYSIKIKFKWENSRKFQIS